MILYASILSNKSLMEEVRTQSLCSPAEKNNRVTNRSLASHSVYLVKVSVSAHCQQVAIFFEQCLASLQPHTHIHTHSLTLRADNYKATVHTVSTKNIAREF